MAMRPAQIAIGGGGIIGRATAWQLTEVQQIVVAAGVDSVALLSDVVRVPRVAERRRLAAVQRAREG